MRLNQRFFALGLCAALSIGASDCNREAKIDDREIPCLDQSALAKVLGHESLELGIDDLSKVLLEGNTNLLMAANRVHKAKETIHGAKLRLLPSINLGSLITSLSNPTFALSSVEYALPFLIPARWFDVKKAKHLWKAEKYSLLIAELNQAASLYALVLSLDADFRVRDVLHQEVQSRMILERWVRDAIDMGQATVPDLKLAQSQSAQAWKRLYQFQGLLVDEWAALRSALGICSSIAFTLKVEDLNFKPSDLEGLPESEVIPHLLTLAPERRQLEHLLKAGEAERWTKVFAFIGPMTAGNSGLVPGESVSFAFSDLSIRAGANFGFDFFSNIKLSNMNLKEIGIRMTELTQELTRVVFSNRDRVELIQKEKDLTQRSETFLKEVLAESEKRYQTGEVSLQSVLLEKDRYLQALIDGIQVSRDMNLNRMNLHRLGKSGFFERFKGCDVESNSPCDPTYLDRKIGKSLD